MQKGKRGLIYKYTSPSGKVYIGQTTDEKGRKWDHENETIKKKTKFSYAIKKYGFNTFKYEVLYTTIFTEDLHKLKRVLDNLEKAYIDFFDSYKNGYNLTLGGDGHLGYVHSEETKDKISLANKGRKRTDESKLKMSISQKGKSCIKVQQFSKDNKFIKEWNSMTEAGNNLGIAPSNISKCCSGKLKSAKGYIWKIINNNKNAEG